VLEDAVTHVSAEDTSAVGDGRGDGAGRDVSFWRSHTQISLQPIAAPSILGLYGLAAATFMVGANLAGWYGNNATPLILFPFAMMSGGLAQFLAGMWSFRARDPLATAIHGMWGSFWLAYGLYYLLVALAALPPPAAGSGAQVGFGYWFIVLGAITWVGAVAATAESAALSLVLLTLAAASTLLAIGWTASLTSLVSIGGIVLVASAVLAFYTASAMMLQGTFGRVVLPIGKRHTPDRPGATPSQPIQYELGEPGVKIGQ
jgi:succinate-acetate transporter protein